MYQKPVKYLNKKAWGFYIPCLCFMAAMVCVPVISFAQSNDIVNRLNRMENEIQTLNRAVYRGEIPENVTPFSGPTPMPAQGGISAAQAGNMEVRLQQMEQELRALTGRVEEQGFVLREMQMKIEALENRPTPQVQVPSQNRQQIPLAQDPALQSRSSDITYTAPGGFVPENMAPSQPNVQSPPPVLQRQGTLAPNGLDPAALYEMSYTTLKNGDFDTAEKSFQSFLDQFPNHTLTPNATYWLAETFYVRNEYEKAAKIFASSYQKFPNSSKSPDSLLKLGLSLKGMGSKNEACLAFKQLLSEFPGGNALVLDRGQREINALSCAS